MNVASQYSGHSGQPVMFPGQPFVSGPMADMAVQYGHTLAGQGTEFVHKNVSTEYCSCCVLVVLLVKQKLSSSTEPYDS